MSAFAIGLDYGTNSMRALLADLSTGEEIATAVYEYPSGEDGVLTDSKAPHLARQNPADYIAGFQQTVREVVQSGMQTHGLTPDQVVGIGIDTTGSTPIPVDAEGTPLALHDEFQSNLAAYAWLWKDHTAHAEADAITQLAREKRPEFLSKCGGIYSSEWYWAKILHCQNVAPEVFAAADSWIELADFMPAYITGNQRPRDAPRGICAAGHKALYHEQWGGLPDAEFLEALGPGLSKLRDTFRTPAVTADRQAGGLTSPLAKQVGLNAGTPVAVGAFDAHMGAVGAGVGVGTLVKIIGTSTCDIMVAPLESELPDVPGLCGIVPESVMPGTFGMEAGQSAVGDIFNWFVQRLTPAEYTQNGDPHAALTAEAEQLTPGESGLLALDWHNGNRTVLVDPLLSGLMVGQTLHTTAPEMYRALIEATAFGALTIIERLNDYGVAVDEVVNCGGIAQKNPFVMQIYADVCNRPMKISRSTQTPALGAAIFASVAGGAYPDVTSAQQKMTGVQDTVYTPNPEAVAVYRELFDLYQRLHDAMGGVSNDGDLGQVMKKLTQIRERQRGG